MKLFSTVFLLGAGAALAVPRVPMEEGILVAEKYSNWASEEINTIAKKQEKMTVYVMMQHSDEARATLEKTLYDVSDPKSDNYGNHLSLDDLKSLCPIDEEAIKIVHDFFDVDGVERIENNHNEDIFQVTLTVAQAETLFETEIRQFTHNTRTDAKIYRASKSYSLPEDVASVVSFIGDLVRVPSLDFAKSNLKMPALEAGADWPNSCPGLGAACQSGVNPGVLAERYNISGTAVADGNSFAVAEFQGQYYDDKDLAKFSAGCNVNVTVDNVVGKDIQEGGVEAMLDVEYIKALSPEIPLTFWYQAEYSLLNWVTALNNATDTPLVHSVSYGNDERQQTSSSYIFTTATQFAKAGTRGISILFASGDQGVCGRSGCGLITHHFHPDFPAACPYVTAVGGTDFLERSTIGDEQAWTDGGGGFSDHFDIPTWQADVVAAYKSDPSANLPPQHMWNNTGRGYPDISALGGEKNPYCVEVNRATEGVAGTSASCPVASSIIARVNGDRLAAGKKPLGFLNPFLYQNAAVFQDVTEGKNSGGGFGGNGFTAIKGWDPATGLGTPNYGLLKEAALAAP